MTTFRDLPFDPAPVVASVLGSGGGDDARGLLPGFELLSTQAAIADYWRRRTNHRWGACWLAVFVSPTGVCVAVDHTGDTDEVLIVDAEGNVVREAVTFAQWLLGLEVAHESGLVEAGPQEWAF